MGGPKKKYFKTLTANKIKQYNDYDVFVSRSAIMKRCENNNKIFSYISQAEYEKAMREISDKQVLENDSYEQDNSVLV